MRRLKSVVTQVSTVNAGTLAARTSCKLGLPTILRVFMRSIGRLKNTGLTEKQIVELIGC